MAINRSGTERTGGRIKAIPRQFHFTSIDHNMCTHNDIHNIHKRGKDSGTKSGNNTRDDQHNSLHSDTYCCIQNHLDPPPTEILFRSARFWIHSNNNTIRHLFDDTKNPNPILYYLVGAYIYYVPPCALLCGLLWWIWTSSNNEQKSRKDQLAILRTTRPFLTKESRQKEDSASGTIRHFTAANTKSKVSISLALTAYTLITAGLILRNRISNQ